MNNAGVSVDNRATSVLDDKQIEFYANEGYLSIETFVPTGPLDWMRAVADEEFAKHSHPDIPGRVDMPSTRHPELLDTEYANRALAVAQQTVHPDVVFLGDWFLDKRPGHPETVWHQDEWRRDKQYPLKYMETWLAIDDTDRDNGCIQVIPKSHTMGIVPRNSDRFQELLSTSIVECPLPPGGCAFWDSRTFHYAGINTTGRPRRAYALTFAWLPRAQMIDYLLERLLGAEQRSLIDMVKQQPLSLANMPNLTLHDLEEQADLFRNLLARPSEQKRLRDAIEARLKAMLGPAPARQPAVAQPDTARIDQQRSAINRQQQLKKQRRSSQ